MPLCGKDGKTGQTLYKTAITTTAGNGAGYGWYSTNILETVMAVQPSNIGKPRLIAKQPFSPIFLVMMISIIKFVFMTTGLVKLQKKRGTTLTLKVGLAFYAAQINWLGSIHP